MIDPELRALVDAYVDGTIDSAQVASLDDALCNNSVFRQWYADQCRREVALRAVLRREQQAALVDSGAHAALLATTTTIEGEPVAASSGTRKITRLRRSGRRSRTQRIQRARSRTPIAPILAAALLLVGVLLGIWASQNGQSTGHAPSDHAVAVVLTAGADAGVEVGARLQAEAPIAWSASVTLRFIASDAVVGLSADTQGRLAADGLDLARGVATVALRKQHPGDSFRITTPFAVATVVGTDFTVTVTETAAALAVRHGTVAWTTAEGRTLVSGGESAQWPPTSVAIDSVPASMPPSVPATGMSAGVTGLVLCDAASGATVAVLTAASEQHIDLGRLNSSAVALRAIVQAQVHGVRYTVEGPDVRSNNQLEAIAPFVYPGDTDGTMERTWQMQPGTYIIEVQGFADEQGRQSLGDRFRVTVVVRAGD